MLLVLFASPSDGVTSEMTRFLSVTVTVLKSAAFSGALLKASVTTTFSSFFSLAFSSSSLFYSKYATSSKYY